ncbi:hypothetical protein ABPG75_002763 [Micractinium tetrahymenae]
MAAGSRLTQLGIRMSTPLDDPGLAILQEARQAVGSFLNRLSASCHLLHAGVELCRLLGDDAATQGFQLSVGLLLGAGNRVLQSCAAARAGCPDTAVLLLVGQLRLMQDLWSLGPTHMAGLVTPPDLLTWLKDAAAAVQAVHAPLLNRGSPPPVCCLSALADVCSTLLAHLALASHRQLLRHDTALKRSLVAVLEPGLPAVAVALALLADQRPAGFTWQLGCSLTAVLAADELDGFLQAHLVVCEGSTGGSHGGRGGIRAACQRLLSASTRLLELAVQQPGDSKGSHGSALLNSCCRLFCRTCARVAGVVGMQQQQPTWHRCDAHVQLTKTVQKAVALMPRTLRLLIGSALVQLLQRGQEEKQPAQLPAMQQQMEGSLAQQASQAARLCSTWRSVVVLLMF